MREQVKKVRKHLDEIESLIDAQVYSPLPDAYWRFHAEAYRLYVLIRQLVR